MLGVTIMVRIWVRVRGNVKACGLFENRPCPSVRPSVRLSVRLSVRPSYQMCFYVRKIPREEKINTVARGRDQETEDRRDSEAGN